MILTTISLIAITESCFKHCNYIAVEVMRSDPTRKICDGFRSQIRFKKSIFKMKGTKEPIKLEPIRIEVFRLEVTRLEAE